MPALYTNPAQIRDAIREAAQGFKDGYRGTDTPQDAQPAQSAAGAAGAAGAQGAENAEQPAAPAPPAPPAPAQDGGGEFTGTFTFGENGLVIQQRSADGTMTTVPFDPGNMIPPQVPVIIGLVGATLIGVILAFPIGRAIARWIDRRSQTPQMPTNVLQRLGAIEAAVDTVAVEMERLSEGQRYTARLLTEHTAAPNFASPVAASDPVNAAANGGANASSNAESERARAHGVRRDDAIRG